MCIMFLLMLNGVKIVLNHSRVLNIWCIYLCLLKPAFLCKTKLIWTALKNIVTNSLKANSVDPDQTAPLRSSLIRVCAVCSFNIYLDCIRLNCIMQCSRKEGVTGII